jgi:ribosome maturation protein SDO1
MGKEVIIKYETANTTFELIGDASLAYDYITGKIKDPLIVVQTEEVFKDARKGERQSEDKIKKIFGTTDSAKVIDQILKKGNVPITTEQRAKLTEEKRKQVINIIARNSIDPRTNAPTPALRVENAIQQAKVSIDPFKSANEQVEDVIKKISMILPIKFATAKIEVTVPPESANRCFNVLKQYGMKSQQWLKDGSMQAVVEFPAGMQSEFYDKINQLTQGKAVTKILT